VWGVGTRLATAYDEPALGAVYKLAAVREPGGAWLPRVKHSEQAIKASTPGLQQVRRFAEGGASAGDVIWDELTGPPARDGVDLLAPAFRGGRRLRLDEPLADARERAITSLGALPADVRRLVDPAPYPVTLEPRLAARREALLAER
jgi:nicotinate phosphoribosyltransferase